MDWATVFVLLVSIPIWTIGLGVVLVAWRRTTTEDDPEYRPDPEDGCGCAGIWEYTSERRSDSETR